MKNLNKYDGISHHDIKEISYEIRNLLKDYSQFIEKLDSLSSFLSKTEIFNKYINQNKIIFELINENKKQYLNIEEVLKVNNFIRENINIIIETSYNKIAIPLEKMDTAICKSMRLIEEKFKLEKAFKNS